MNRTLMAALSGLFASSALAADCTPINPMDSINQEWPAYEAYVLTIAPIGKSADWSKLDVPGLKVLPRLPVTPLLGGKVEDLYMATLPASSLQRFGQALRAAFNPGAIGPLPLSAPLGSPAGYHTGKQFSYVKAHSTAPGQGVIGAELGREPVTLDIQVNGFNGENGFQPESSITLAWQGIVGWESESGAIGAWPTAEQTAPDFTPKTEVPEWHSATPVEQKASVTTCIKQSPDEAVFIGGLLDKAVLLLRTR
ncbi:uncharacterized protein NMK_2496 [Novimethylophilus kurashikiensis]|uniref:Uncharacterized protein n=1 Tax=Novimethylophilus kurashikiensis TaxID=1825523 RepID=A0A2R5FA33_9PROT|nr:hypothetical protein [Novimethylophilus kurashikiensis]GBG14895.1 uncharacterized protein NMK_2496 [Novimethylophilus kurashikiensis]